MCDKQASWGWNTLVFRTCKTEPLCSCFSQGEESTGAPSTVKMEPPLKLSKCHIGVQRGSHSFLLRFAEQNNV